MSKSTLGGSQIVMVLEVTRVGVNIKDAQSQSLPLVEIVFDVEAGGPLRVTAVGDGLCATKLLPVSTDSILVIYYKIGILMGYSSIL